jgi:hypothetical protein
VFLQAAYAAGDKALAAKVAASVRKDLQQQIRYYDSLTGRKAEAMAQDRRMADEFLRAMDQMEQMYNGKPAVIENGQTIKTDSSK